MTQIAPTVTETFYPLSDGGIMNVAISDNNKLIAYMKIDPLYHVGIIDKDEMNTKPTWTIPGLPAGGLAFSADAKTLAAGFFGGVVLFTVDNNGTMKRAKEIVLPRSEPVHWLTFSKSGRVLFIATDQTIFVFDVTKERITFTWPTTGDDRIKNPTLSPCETIYLFERYSRMGSTFTAIFFENADHLIDPKARTRGRSTFMPKFLGPIYAHDSSTAFVAFSEKIHRISLPSLSAKAMVDVTTHDSDIINPLSENIHTHGMPHLIVFFDFKGKTLLNAHMQRRDLRMATSKDRRFVTVNSITQKEFKKQGIEDLNGITLFDFGRANFGTADVTTPLETLFKC